MSSSREEKAKELYSTRPRELPKAPPIITIDTTNLGATPFGNSTLGSDLPARQSSSILDQSPYANQDSTLTHMNVLRVPSFSKHQRSNSSASRGSDMSGWSGWTPSPSTDVHGSDVGDMNIDDHTLPEPSLESTREQDPTPFAFTKTQVGKRLYDPKDLSFLGSIGGLEGLSLGLQVNLSNGLSPDEDILDVPVTLEDVWRTLSRGERPEIMHHDESPRTQSSLRFRDRRRVFGENKIPVRRPKNILELMWIALHDKVLILLSIAAVTSLALGLYQTFRPGSTSKLEWIEGVAILTAVAIVTIAQSVNDYQKERQFAKLNQKKDDREVIVVRGGRTISMSVYDLLVGDILLLEPGDIVPVDAILVEANDIKCDESSATGESDTLEKVSADIALQSTEGTKSDPFILSGTKVLDGVGRAVVTAVGTNSCYGRMMLSFQDDPEDTPLQIRLNRIADMIAKWGGGIALLLFVILVIKFFIRLPGSVSSPGEKVEHLMQILIISISIIVVAVPEGLPLAVTLSLAYATIRMIQDNNLVRVLKACETIGNATTICSDKTGTLTENKMTVVAGTLGTVDKFEKDSQILISIQAEGMNMESFFDQLPTELMNLLRESIVLNSTAFEGDDGNGNKQFIGSKTETALLEMAKLHLNMNDVATERNTAKPRQVHQFPFNSERKCMGVVLSTDHGYRLYVKGASEIVLGQSSRVITTEGYPRNLSNEDRRVIASTIEDYASHSLRTIAFAYRDFQEHVSGQFEHVFADMVFIGVAGIKDPLRPGVNKAVSDCGKAGVMVRMVTGDNVSTAKAIATECGIYTDGIIMEGPQFRKLSRPQMTEVIPRLQVLARSSPEDKRILVKHLRRSGQIVAVTGDGTNDAPALRAADVGFSMGLSGTEVAKAASSIILMDDNFTSIVKAIAWGRCVNDAVKKFLQFQLTVSVTAVGFAFVSSVVSTDESSALTAVQLLWVNLLQDTLAALALATDPPTLELLNRKPEPKGSSLISFNMWKMIFGQSVVQLVVIFVLNFHGTKFFPGWDNDALKTVVFNTFVWLQIFNEINCRRLDNKLNVFSGISQNSFFIVIMIVMVGCQTLIIFFGGAAFSVHQLDSQQWLVSVSLGFLSLPAGAVIRLIPNDFIEFFIPTCILERSANTDLESERVIEDWDDAMEAIQDDLRFFKRLRGQGRFGRSQGKSGKETDPPNSTSDSDPATRQPSFDDNSRESHSPSTSRPFPSSLYSVNAASTMVPGLIALSTALAPVALSDKSSTNQEYHA